MRRWHGTCGVGGIVAVRDRRPPAMPIRLSLPAALLLTVLLSLIHPALAALQW